MRCWKISGKAAAIDWRVVPLERVTAAIGLRAALLEQAAAAIGWELVTFE